MPRISEELSKSKQEFVLGILTSNPKLTVREVQEQLKVKFAGVKGGESMNPRTVLDLRNGLLNPQTSPIVTMETAESTETIVTPEVVPDVQTAVGPEAVDEVLAANPPPTPPSPVIQVAAPEPKAAIVPEEGVTYRKVDLGLVQITDADGRTYLRKAEPKTETESA
jgi:hypothetical protein